MTAAREIGDRLLHLPAQRRQLPRSRPRARGTARTRTDPPPPRRAVDRRLLGDARQERTDVRCAVRRRRLRRRARAAARIARAARARARPRGAPLARAVRPTPAAESQRTSASSVQTAAGDTVDRRGIRPRRRAAARAAAASRSAASRNAAPRALASAVSAITNRLRPRHNAACREPIRRAATGTNPLHPRDPRELADQHALAGAARPPERRDPRPRSVGGVKHFRQRRSAGRSTIRNPQSAIRNRPSRDSACAG